MLSSTAILASAAEVETTRWRLDADRCALELDYGFAALTVWRARLRVIEAELVRTATDADGLLQLSAVVAARPAYASLPGTRGWFLPLAARREQIRIAGTVATPEGDGHQAARVSVGTAQWVARIVVRFTPGDGAGDRVVVVGCGVIVPRVDTPLPGGRTRLELAAEFLRCG